MERFVRQISGSGGQERNLGWKYMFKRKQHSDGDEDTQEKCAEEQVGKSSLRKFSQRGRRNKRERESNFTKINREKKCKGQSTGSNAPQKKNEMKMKNAHSIWQ